MVAEATRQARGGPSDTDRYLVTVDTATGEVERHRAPRFADCVRCGAGAQPAQSELAPEPIELRSAAAHGDGDGGWWALTPEQALARLEPIVSPLTGIASIIDMRELAPGLYVTMAVQTHAERVDPRANRRLGKPGSAAGKGVSPVQARVSCLAEAILGFSARQYEERDVRNEDAEKIHFIPERFREDAVVEWSPAWSLTHAAPRWLATRQCYFDYAARDVPDDHRFAAADSNGCAAGGTLDEAVLQALLELVERDAVSIWWYNRLRRPAADLSGVDAAYVAAMRDYHAAENRSLEVLDLTTDLGIPAMAAVSARLDDGGGVAMGLGAHVDARIAATRAMTELNQGHVLDESFEMEERAPDEEWACAREWYEKEVISDHPYLIATDGPPAAPAADDGLAAMSIGDAVRHCVDRIADKGHEVIVQDFNRPHLPLDCARVVAPGLVHFWNRRGGSRR